ncbi:MAG: hypothetical protein AAF804_01895 [Bacteroidota bacterium]
MRLNRLLSQILVILYLAITFSFRFFFEAQLIGHYWVSLVTGGLCLLLLWALIKNQVLNPGWFWFEEEFKAEAKAEKANR